MDASANRLKAIAAERAEIMATMIQASCAHGGQASGGQHRAAEGKWERKDGVLPLDHLERDAQVAEQGHR